MIRAVYRDFVRLMLDMTTVSSSIKRLSFWSDVASEGFSILNGNVGEALETMIAVEAVGRGEQGQLKYLAANPEMQDRAEWLAAARTYQISGQTANIPYSDAQPDKIDAARSRLLTEKYVNEFRFDPAYDLISARAFETANDEPCWQLTIAYTAFRVGDRPIMQRALANAFFELKHCESGLHNQDFWQTLDAIDSADGNFSSHLGDAITNLWLEQSALDAAPFIIGAAKIVARSPQIEITSLERALHSVLRLGASPDYIAGARARDFKSLVALSAQIADRLKGSCLADVAAGEAETSEQIMRREFAEQSLRQAQQTLARLQFSTGQEASALTEWVNRTVAIPDPDAVELAPITAKSHDIAKLADLAELPSVQRVWSAPIQPRLTSVMSRVDAAPMRQSYHQHSTFCVLQDGASVITGDRCGSAFWYVETREGPLIVDGLNVHPRFHFGSMDERFAAASPQGNAMVLSTDPKKDSFSAGQHVLIGGIDNYYHWMMEYLPKFKALALCGLESFDKLKFIVNDNLAPWQLETLSAMGAGLDQIVRMGGGHRLTCSQLYVPSLPNAPAAAKFLRDRLRPSGAAQNGQRVYVSRIDTSPDRRRIADEEKLVTDLQAVGFHILIPTEVSFDEQIETFANASIIVGAHGAALTNIAFCDPDALVVEITNRHNHSYGFFSQIAASVGVSHLRYRAGLEIPSEEAENGAAVVNADQLVRFVDAAWDRHTVKNKMETM